MGAIVISAPAVSSQYSVGHSFLCVFSCISLPPFIFSSKWTLWWEEGTPRTWKEVSESTFNARLHLLPGVNWTKIFAILSLGLFTE